MKKLGAVIIAKNEEKRIGKCIDSLSFCDEVYVIDNNSSDDTASYAKKRNATVFRLDSIDFSELRNFALKHVKTEWLLYIDADEIVTKALSQEILKTIESNTEFTAFRLTRVNFYLGDTQWPKNEKLERLFKTDKLIKWYGKLHESAKVDGRIGELRKPLLHYTHRNLSEMVQKTLEWSQTEARLRFEQNHPQVVWWRFPRVMLTGFLDSYIRQGGYKVGTVGLIESMYQAFSMFITYARLWELQKTQKHS